MKDIDIRVTIDPEKVGPPGPETVLLERLMKDHAFVKSVAIVRGGPDETTRRTK